MKKLSALQPSRVFHVRVNPAGGKDLSQEVGKGEEVPSSFSSLSEQAWVATQVGAERILLLA